MCNPPASISTPTHPTRPSSSDFKVIFEKAFEAYRKQTKQDLTAIPLFSQLQACDSPAAILTILQGQVDQFIQSRSGDERLKRWLSPTINVLYAFSATIGAGVGLVNVNLSVGDILPTYSTGFLSGKCDICWCRCPPFGQSLVYLLVSVPVTLEDHRRLRTSKIAKMSLSMSSSASKISFEDLKFIPMSHKLRL